MDNNQEENDKKLLASIYNMLKTHPVATANRSQNKNVVKDIFHDFNHTEPRLFDSPVDVLALSCAWRRIRSNSLFNFKHFVLNFFDEEVKKNLNEEDVILANNIRDYYSKKLMWLKIKGLTLTRFREDLNQFIHSDGLKVDESKFGMIYRLPEFYEYDITLDNIFSNHNSKIDHVHPKRMAKKLSYVDLTIRTFKCQKQFQYWFSDDDKNLVCIKLDVHNPLINIWEQLIDKPLIIEGTYHITVKDNRNYFLVDKFSFKMLDK